jgi:hypothetical protein
MSHVDNLYLRKIGTNKKGILFSDEGLKKYVDRYNQCTLYMYRN